MIPRANTCDMQDKIGELENRIEELEEQLLEEAFLWCDEWNERTKRIKELEELVINSTPNKHFVWQKRWGMIPPKALEHITKLEAELSMAKEQIKILLDQKTELARLYMIKKRECDMREQKRNKMFKELKGKEEQ